MTSILDADQVNEIDECLGKLWNLYVHDEITRETYIEHTDSLLDVRLELMRKGA